MKGEIVLSRSSPDHQGRVASERESSAGQLEGPEKVLGKKMELELSLQG